MINFGDRANGHIPTSFPGHSHSAGNNKTPVTKGESAVIPTLPIIPLEETPVPLSEAPGPLPSFPFDAFPSWLSNYCHEVAAYLEIPSELCGMLALGVLSTAMNGKAEVHAREGWNEAINLYLLVVAASAERKSPAFKAFYGVAHAWETETRKRIGADMAASISEHHAYVKSAARAENELAKAETDADKAKARESIKEIQAYLAEHPEPLLPRLFIDDTSSEKLADTIARYGGRITLASPEGHGFFARAGGLYSSGQASLDVFLKAHGGESIQVDRIGRGSIHIARPALTIALCLQPQVLRSLQKSKSFRGTGLLARFLIAIPDPKVGTRTHETSAVRYTVKTAYEFRMKSLLDLPAPTGEEKIPLLRFDWLASAELRTFMQTLEPRLDPIRGDLSSIADWGGKLAGQTARIAALLHCAEHSGEIGMPEEVSALTVQKAVKVSTFLLEHARRAFGAIEGGEETERALFVLNKIRGLNKTPISKTDLLRACRTIQADEMKKILGRLVDHGFLVELMPENSKKQTYRVKVGGNDGNDGKEEVKP